MSGMLQPGALAALAALAAFAVVSVRADAGGPSAIDPQLRRVLAEELRFSPGDLAALARGRVAKHNLPTHDSHEVAVVGAVRVQASRAAFLDRFRDIATFKRGPSVPEVGRFSSPPALADLATFSLDEKDVDALRKCRPGACDLQLPNEVIARFQGIDWSRPDARRDATDLMKRVLVEHATSYLEHGAGELSRYDDDGKAFRPAEEFAELVKSSPYIGALVPALPDYIERFPSMPLPGAENFLYWSVERFGFSPFISLTHVTIAHAPPGANVITSKDVYSSRYFDTSLGLTIASDAPERPGTFYLIYVNRSRAPALGGFFSGLRHSIVERRVRDGMEQNLIAVKTRLERGAD